MTEALMANQTVDFQKQFNGLWGRLPDIFVEDTRADIPVVTSEFIMGKPIEWRFGPLFRQPASDLQFIQGGRCVGLKDYLPGDYWIYGITYSRQNLLDGEKLTGQSQGPYIYIPRFTNDFAPTPLEVGTANVIAFHEAGHQVVDQNNRELYQQYLAQLGELEDEDPLYMAVLREMKSRHELGAWDLTLGGIMGMRQSGIELFTSSLDDFKSLFLGALRSQASFLDFSLPAE